MKIAVNTSPAVAGGSVTHLRHLLPEMLQLLGDDELVAIGNAATRERIEAPPELEWIDAPNIGEGLRRRLLWESRELPGILDDIGADVFFHPSNFRVHRARVPQVVLIHNLAPYLPAVFVGESAYQKLRLILLRLVTRDAIKRTAETIFISQWGKELVRGRDSGPDRFPVIPFGCEHGREIRDVGALEKYGVERDGFVLTVSHFYRYKRIEYLIDAYAALGERVREWPLLIVGEPYDAPYGARLRRHAEACAAPVVFTGALGAAEIAELMDACRVFAFTSEAENLPITLLEAMSAGSPILTNRACSMPETCLDAAVYADPTSADTYRVELERMLWDDALRADLAERARARAATFRWSDTARSTLEVLRRVARDGR